MDVLLCDIYSNSHKYWGWNWSNFAGWGMPQGTGSTIITCNNVNASASNIKRENWFSINGYGGFLG